MFSYHRCRTRFFQMPIKLNILFSSIWLTTLISMKKKNYKTPHYLYDDVYKASCVEFFNPSLTPLINNGNVRILAIVKIVLVLFLVHIYLFFTQKRHIFICIYI